VWPEALALALALGIAAAAMVVAPPTGQAQGAPRGAAKAAAGARRAASPPRRAAASSRARTARTRTPVLPALHFTTPRGAEALAADLASLLRARTRTGVWGAMVVSLTRGDTLFAHEPGAALVPASTMKLFTAALALDRLGPEHTFSTDVLRDGPMDEDGVVHGNLILRGDGDPSLSARFVRGGPDAPMTLLAELVAGAGVRRVTGDLVADATAVDDRRIPQGWLSRYAGAAYAAPYSALSLNENLAVVAVVPGDAAGRMARVVLEPAAHGISVTSTVRTVAGRGASISARAVGDDQILVSGTIGAQAAEARYLVTMSDPARFTAGAFRAALAARGITVAGAIRLAPTPADAVLVTGLPSPPLSHLVSVMNRESINVFAELLWRVAARGPGREVAGTTERAAQSLREFLADRVGLPADAVQATDGSGLSVLDRVTPRALVRLLDHAHRAPWGSAFHASLPVAGESELLRTRMKATPAQGNLHAKTGTTNEVIGLSGYVTAENGELLAFAFLYNGTDRWHAREAIDAMGPTLAAFSRD
jgi:D-alanyl-D-alanine carboxypeptidase/D-alanyl-D-alanine-endopeptidase (penicillin-binding protein 4)